MSRLRPTTLAGGLCVILLGIWILLERRRRRRHVTRGRRPGSAGDDRPRAARQRPRTTRVGSRHADRRSAAASRSTACPHGPTARSSSGVCCGSWRRPSASTSILLRVAFLALAAAGGAGIVLYALAAIAMPSHRARCEHRRHRGRLPLGWRETVGRRPARAQPPARAASARALVLRRRRLAGRADGQRPDAALAPEHGAHAGARLANACSASR